MQIDRKAFEGTIFIERYIYIYIYILFLISKVLILAIMLNGDVRIQLLSNACNYSSIQLDMIFNKIRRLVPFLMFL